MKSIFFEWQDYESLIAKEYNLDLNEIKTTSGKFNLDEASGFEIISIFVDSRISNEDLKNLKDSGCKKILLRCAGFNMLDPEFAKSLGLEVYRVASYSPESIAEFVFALLLNLIRRLNLQRRLHNTMSNGRTIDAMGFTLRGKTIGIHGYGKIGREVANIARNGFKMNVIFFDPFVPESNGEELKVNSLEELYEKSDVVSVHMPLNKDTENSVNIELLSRIKDTFVLINTSRGGIVDNSAVIETLKSKKHFFFGTDVWGNDDKFDDRLLVDHVFQADHIAFFTKEAVQSILEQTLDSLKGNAAKENIL